MNKQFLKRIDRMLFLGEDAVKEITKTNILIVGLNGLGVEIGICHFYQLIFKSEKCSINGCSLCYTS